MTTDRSLFGGRLFRPVTLATVLLAGRLGSGAQGAFQNLDFEAARIVPTGTPFAIATSNALPGWSAFSPIVYYNAISLGAAAISIHDRSDLPNPAFEGNYSILLQRSYPDGLISPSLWQAGIIPQDSRSLRYLGGVSSVTFKGQPLEFTLLGYESGKSLWGADVSSLAGQTGELRFSGDGWLDAIAFSPNTIPEPSALTLMVLGGARAFFRSRRGSPF